MIDLCGHVGYILLLVGTYLVSKNHAAGWAMRGVGSAIWLCVGAVMGMSSIWIWGSFFLVLDVVGFRRWKRKRSTTT